MHFTRAGFHGWASVSSSVVTDHCIAGEWDDRCCTDEVEIEGPNSWKLFPQVPVSHGPWRDL